MRVLLVPRIECVDGANSLTICPTMLMRAWLELDPNCSFVLPVHENFADPSWLANYYFTPEQIERVWLLPLSKKVLGNKPTARRIRNVVGNALLERLGPTTPNGQFIDIAISNGCFASNASLRCALAGLFGRIMKREIPFIGWAEWVPVHAWGSGFISPWEVEACLLGAFAADYVVWQSEVFKQDFVKSLRPIASASALAKLLEHSEVCQTGIISDKLTLSEYDGKTAPVGMWSGYWKEDFKICVPPLLDALKVGALSKVIIQFLKEDVATLQEEVRRLQALDNVEVHFRMTQEEYFKLIGRVHLFATQAVNSPTYGLRWGEAMASGIVPVVCSRIATTFLPDDYPFVVRPGVKWTEMVIAAARHIRRNPTFGKQVANFVLAEHDFRTAYAKFYMRAEKMVTAARAQTNYGDFEGIARRVLEGVSEIRHSDAVRAMDKFTTSDASLATSNLVPPGLLRWAILEQGFCDDSTSWDDPNYARVGDV